MPQAVKNAAGLIGRVESTIKLSNVPRDEPPPRLAFHQDEVVIHRLPAADAVVTVVFVPRGVSDARGIVLPVEASEKKNSPPLVFHSALS